MKVDGRVLKSTKFDEGVFNLMRVDESKEKRIKLEES